MWMCVWCIYVRVCSMCAPCWFDFEYEATQRDAQHIFETSDLKHTKHTYKVCCAGVLRRKGNVFSNQQLRYRYEFHVMKEWWKWKHKHNATDGVSHLPHIALSQLSYMFSRKRHVHVLIEIDLHTHKPNPMKEKTTLQHRCLWLQIDWSLSVLNSKCRYYLHYQFKNVFICIAIVYGHIINLNVYLFFASTKASIK